MGPDSLPCLQTTNKPPNTTITLVTLMATKKEWPVKYTLGTKGFGEQNTTNIIPNTPFPNDNLEIVSARLNDLVTGIHVLTN